jgi:hypothetical protein
VKADRVDECIDQERQKTEAGNSAVDKKQRLVETLLTNGCADKAPAGINQMKARF